MQYLPTPLLASMFSLLLNMSFVAATHADGLTDLNAALDRLQEKSTISATIDYSVTQMREEDDEQEIKQGAISAAVAYGPAGLQVTYDTNVMARLKTEAEQRVKDEEANTPTLMAINDIDAVEFNNILSSADSIKRTLQQAQFIDEQPVEMNGKTLRQLNFDLPLEAIINDKRTRKYVKKYTTQYQILIDETGTPIETTLSYRGKGRAYIVISIEASGDLTTKYAVFNGRLVRVYQKTSNRYDGTFGAGETSSTYTLEVNG